MESGLDQIQPVEFTQVRRRGDEPLPNGLMDKHHYLGFKQPVREHLKYVVWGARPPDCMHGVVKRAAAHLLARPLHRLGPASAAPHTRFLILPWGSGEVSGFAHSGRMTARISEDWQQVYGHPIYFLETFVDPKRLREPTARHTGALLGKTTGQASIPTAMY